MKCDTYSITLMSNMMYWLNLGSYYIDIVYEGIVLDLGTYEHRTLTKQQNLPIYTKMVQIYPVYSPLYFNVSSCYKCPISSMQCPFWCAKTFFFFFWLGENTSLEFTYVSKSLLMWQKRKWYSSVFFTD